MEWWGSGMSVTGCDQASQPGQKSPNHCVLFGRDQSSQIMFRPSIYFKLRRLSFHWKCKPPLLWLHLPATMRHNETPKRTWIVCSPDNPSLIPGVICCDCEVSGLGWCQHLVAVWKVIFNQQHTVNYTIQAGNIRKLSLASDSEHSHQLTEMKRVMNSRLNHSDKN